MYGQVVVDVRSVQLPESIIGIFFLAGAGLQFEQARDAARDVHTRFEEEFGIAPPLLQLDLRPRDRRTAFTLADWYGM